MESTVKHFHECNIIARQNLLCADNSCIVTNAASLTIVPEEGVAVYRLIQTVLDYISTIHRKNDNKTIKSLKIFQIFE